MPDDARGFHHQNPLLLLTLLCSHLHYPMRTIQKSLDQWHRLSCLIMGASIESSPRSIPAFHSQALSACWSLMCHPCARTNGMSSANQLGEHKGSWWVVLREECRSCTAWPNVQQRGMLGTFVPSLAHSSASCSCGDSIGARTRWMPRRVGPRALTPSGKIWRWTWSSVCRLYMLVSESAPPLLPFLYTLNWIWVFIALVQNEQVALIPLQSLQCMHPWSRSAHIPSHPHD